MSTNPALLWTAKPPAPRQPRPGELLFAVNARGGTVTCELRHHGESFGWEAQFLRDGELLYSHGGFTTRALAIQWANAELEGIQPDREP